MDISFVGEIWFWRGPSPFHFVTVPDAEADLMRAEWGFASYGWGMLPVTVRIGATTFTTSLFPKDGRYVVPIKDVVRRAEQLDEGDEPRLTVTLRLKR
jgi:hypothetical protein